MFVYAANRHKTEVCCRSSENQAQYEYRFIVIEIVKLNVVERGTVSNSHRELERHCVFALHMYICRLAQKVLLVALRSCKLSAAVFAEAKEFKRLFYCLQVFSKAVFT